MREPVTIYLRDLRCPEAIDETDWDILVSAHGDEPVGIVRHRVVESKQIPDGRVLIRLARYIEPQEGIRIVYEALVRAIGLESSDEIDPWGQDPDWWRE